MFNIGGSELFFILFIALMMFGSKKIPEIARGLGKGIREMKDAASGLEKELTKGMEEIKDIKEETNVQKMLDKK